MLCYGIEPHSDAYKTPASPAMLTELIWWSLMELNHLPATPLNNGYRVTAGNGEQAPKFGGDDWSRTSSAFRAADLQSTGVTNFPTSPNC